MKAEGANVLDLTLTERRDLGRSLGAKEQWTGERQRERNPCKCIDVVFERNGPQGAVEVFCARCGANLGVIR